MSEPWVLGISASHNGAVCLLHGDEIVVAIQEERLSRWKRHKLYAGRPFLSLHYVLDAAGIGVDDLSAVVLCAQGHRDASVNDLRQHPVLGSVVRRVPLWTLSHHGGHALSTFATSGFARAAVMVVDGVGSPLDDLSDDERDAIVTTPNGHETISLYDADGTDLRCLEKHMVTRHIDRDIPGLPRFYSLGMMFGAIAHHVFGNALDAGKVMGLAPYGRRAFAREELLELDGATLRFTNRVCERFTTSERWPERRGDYQDLARSAQEALEEALLWLARRLRERSSATRLCFAGGVALNSIANERLIRESGFDEVSIMPAAEDSGPAIGAAYYGLWKLTGRNTRRVLSVDAVGRRYDDADVSAAIAATQGVVATRSDDVVVETATSLADGAIVGWFQGRSELGPRALGQRSILLDPRRDDGKDVLNARVKFREAFRPFAPAVLLEHAAEWFELDGAPEASAFMLRVCRFRSDKAAEVPAVAHIDGTGRMQTVTADNGRFQELIAAFHGLTGVPILLNTSFNVMGEPIVETPEDALWCLLSTGLDLVVIGDHIVRRAPGLVGILDLRPRVIGRMVAVEQVSEEASAALDDVAGGHVEFEIPTRWGTTHQRAPRDYVPVLPYIDGERSGHELVEAMSKAEGAVNAKFVELALSRLRRARIIDFPR